MDDLIIREFSREDAKQCISVYEDAYRKTYYRKFVYSENGWLEANKNPFLKILVGEVDGEIAAVSLDLWNKLGWVEFGGLVVKRAYRRRGIATKFMLQAYKHSMDMMRTGFVNFTIPYDPYISNSARDIRAIFCGVNGIYQILNRHVIFSVYNSVNEFRLMNRVPGFVPDIFQDQFQNMSKFIRGPYRRYYRFRKLKEYEIKHDQNPKLQLHWDLNQYLLNSDAEIIEGDWGLYAYDSANRNIKVLRLDDFDKFLNFMKDFYKSGIVIDFKIITASESAPELITRLLQNGFRISNCCLASVTLKPELDQIITIDKADASFPEEYKTADFIELVSPAERFCILSGNINQAIDDPNVVRYLEQFPQGSTLNPRSQTKNEAEQKARTSYFALLLNKMEEKNEDNN